MAARKKKGRRARYLVLSYLEQVSSQVFENYSKEITELAHRKQGVYALYKGSRLYYVGLATNLKNRVKHHLKDKHAGKWDKFSVYLVRRSDHIRELESLVLRIAVPKGNVVKGRLAQAVNLRPLLKRKIKQAANREIDVLLGSRRIGRLARGGDGARKGRRSGPVLAPYVAKPFRIRAAHKGVLYKAIVRRDGAVRLDGRVYNSPSSAGYVITGRGTNGWFFWRFRDKRGDWVRLNELRK